MKKSKNYLALPAIVLAALYLTFLVNLHTLETSLQRVFIFCYFVVMGVLACFLKGKYAEGKPFPLQSRIAAALLAALLVGAGWNTFLPHVRFPLEGSHMYALWEKLLYTLGAWFYARKGFRYHHMVWHLLIDLAVAAHFAGIVFYLY